jgi:hemolysin III
VLNTLKYPIRSLIGITAVFLSVVASILLVYRAATQGSVWHVVSFTIYAISLITLWTISTLYHSLNVSSKVNRTLEQLDHAMIYFLIAGTYTPICLIVLYGAWGWSLFCVNWALAITGIVLKLVFRRPAKWLRILFFIFYIIMGWLVVIAWFPLSHAMPQTGIFWLVLGGIFYTVGAGIFNLRKVAVPLFGAHEIWHLFVLAGSFCHFWMMYNFVVYLK